MGSFGAILQATVVALMTSSGDWSALFLLLSSLCALGAVVLVPWMLQSRPIAHKN
jgi:sugar phosphate permease